MLTCRIMDMAEYKLMKMGKSKAEAEGEKAWKAASSMVSANYPSTTYKNYMINFANAGLAGPVSEA